MTTCTYNGCLKQISQYSRLGLCAHHEQAAWEFLATPEAHRQWLYACKGCGKRPPSPNKKFCTDCAKAHRHRERITYMEERDGRQTRHSQGSGGFRRPLSLSAPARPTRHA